MEFKKTSVAAEGAVDSKGMRRVRWHIWETSEKVLEWAGGHRAGGGGHIG